jgi:hypothetical protein
MDTNPDATMAAGGTGAADGLGAPTALDGVVESARRLGVELETEEAAR